MSVCWFFSNSISRDRTYGPNLSIVDVPYTARAIDVLAQDPLALVLGLCHHDHRASVEVPLGSVGAFGRVIQSSTYEM